MGLSTKDFTKMLESQLSNVLDMTDYKYWDITAESLLVRSKAFGNVLVWKRSVSKNILSLPWATKGPVRYVKNWMVAVSALLLLQMYVGMFLS